MYHSSTNIAKIAHASYGLEFPWRPRSVLSLIPKPLKKMLAAQLEIAKKYLLNVFRGVQEGLAPAKVAAFFKSHIVPMIMKGFKGIMEMMNSKLNPNSNSGTNAEQDAEVDYDQVVA